MNRFLYENNVSFFNGEGLHFFFAFFFSHIYFIAKIFILSFFMSIAIGTSCTAISNTTIAIGRNAYINSSTCKNCGKRKAICPRLLGVDVSECGKCYTMHTICNLCFGMKSNPCLFCPEIPMSRCVNCNHWSITMWHGAREFPFCKPLWCYKCFSRLQCVQCGDICTEAFQFREGAVQSGPNSLCVHCVDDLILQPLIHSLPLALIGIIQNYITE